MLSINNNYNILDSELEYSFVKSSGPGGQNVNKLNTKAVLKWDIRNSKSLPFFVLNKLKLTLGNQISKSGHLILSSEKTRNQEKNKQDVELKLIGLINNAFKRPKKRIPTRPGKNAVDRRIQGKKANSQNKKNRKIPKDFD